MQVAAARIMCYNEQQKQLFWYEKTDKQAQKSKTEALRVLKFVLFSASAGIIRAGSFALMDSVLHWRYWVAYLVALSLSVIWNFTFNRKFTFRSKANVPSALALAFAFYLWFTPLTTWGGNTLVETCGWNEYLVLAITMLLNLSLEFLWQRYLIYGNKIDNAIEVKNEK